MRLLVAGPGRDGRAVKIRALVNGVEQGVFLEAGAEGSPVLLFVHGGPGMPEYWLTRRHPARLREAFTVAWWEQRGAGLSTTRPSLPRP